MKRANGWAWVAALVIAWGTSVARADIPPEATYSASFDIGSEIWTVAPGSDPVQAPYWINPTDIYVPNIFQPEWIKHFFLEIEYFTPEHVIEPGGPIPFPEVIDPLTGVSLIDVIVTGPAVTYHWTIQPQPQYEIVHIPIELLTGAAVIDVGSFCVPEPAALMLLLTGGSAMGWRIPRRRR